LTSDVSARPFSYLVNSAISVARRPRVNRITVAVENEYSAGWREYRGYLDQAKTVDQWLTVPGVEAQQAYYNVDGQLRFVAFDSAGFYRNALLQAIAREFPDAKSVTEYGAGVGRNLIYLKRSIPGIDAFGYELCQPGVDAAAAAADKFDLDISYAQLDYLHDGEEKFVHPKTDVAFTMFSLEQLPEGCETALRHMLDHVRLGTLHIEPVPENYPFSFRGLLGRLDHWKAGYLSGFDKAVRRVGAAEVTHTRLESAHNPLMFPSLYVLKK
jgi:hypothetical protein